MYVITLAKSSCLDILIATPVSLLLLFFSSIGLFLLH